jgi:flagellar M-ring protein FliF
MQWLHHFNHVKANLLALGARKLAALITVVAVTMLGVGAIGFYSSRSETEALYTGLGASDVSRMGTALQSAGIPFDVSADGTRVLVRRPLAAQARMLLAEKGLPSGSTSGYELFDKLGPIGLTSFMQEVTRTRALEGELARTIQTMRGVKSARVHIVYPEASSFRRQRQPATASVVVRMEGLREPSAGMVIRHLVAAAVPSLTPEQVSVMSTDGTILIASGEGGGTGSGKLIELERSFAGQLQDNVRRTLAPYLGIENFEVTVAARLNFDKRQQSEQTYDPEAKAERSTRVVKETGLTQGAAARTAVTVEQNVPGEAGAQGTGEQTRKSNERREELTNFEINSKTVAVASEGHRIESLNVAVVVNRKRLLATLAGAADPKEMDQRIKEIEVVVAAAAGINASRGDKVSVAAFDFADVGSEGASKISIVDGLMMHLDRVIIALTALAAIAIFIWLGLLPAVRAIANQSAARATEALQTVDAVGAVGGSADVKQIPGAVAPEATLPSPVPSTNQQKLAELIARDEKQVAQILKQWMAKA